MTKRQSTAVAIGGRALLIEGAPGSGKSSLALQLIDRGAVLIGDDGISLGERGGALWASPAQATSGLIELRNVGIVRLPVAEAPVALVLALCADAPRFAERPDAVAIAGREVPLLMFDPAIPGAAVRAEHALALHGLPVSRTA